MLVNGIFLGLAMVLARVILLAVTLLPALLPLPDDESILAEPDEPSTA
jgi:hypothetical protein